MSCCCCCEKAEGKASIKPDSLELEILPVATKPTSEEKRKRKPAEKRINLETFLKRMEAKALKQRSLL